MNLTKVWMVVSLVGAMAFASSTVYAQRGGGGGHGGGVSGAPGGGMPSGMQQSGRNDAIMQQGGRNDAMQSIHSDQQFGTHMRSERPLSDNHVGGGKTANELIQQNTRLSSNLSRLMPTGTDMQTAADGFKNLGEFVSAVHVSHNLGIPFDALKAQMFEGDSLGEAIQVLNPNADAQAEERRARAQAKKDLGSS